MSEQLVTDFENGVRTAQGGWFMSTGGRPDVVCDALVEIGSPKARAWRIEVSADAPANGVGGFIPLFDQLAGRPTALDVRQTPFLELRLIGQLGERALRVEICPDAVPDPELAGSGIQSLKASELPSETWKDFVAPLRIQPGPLKAAGAIRILLEGRGAAWIAIDRVRLCGGEQPETWHAAPPAAPRNLRKALWVWTTDEIYPDASKRDALLTFAKQHGFTDLFCQLVYAFESGVVQLKLVDEQRAFLAACRKDGVRVHALDGAPRYVLPEHHARMHALVEAIDGYNRAAPADARYDALHLDNEPYILPEWKDAARRPAVIAAFVELNRELRKRCNAVGLEYGIDIPFWFDQRMETDKPTFLYEGQGGPTPLLDELFQAVQNVGIMSYRERVAGPAGVVGVCQTEFALGRKHGVGVWPALETGTGKDVEPGITYGVYPYRYLQAQLGTLEKALEVEPGCQGYALHYYQSLQALEDRR